MNLNHHLGSINATEVAQTVFGALNLIQERSPAQQLVAACCLYQVLCTTFQVDPRDVQAVTTNLLTSQSAQALAEFKALQDYLHNEIRPHAFV